MSWPSVKSSSRSEVLEIEWNDGGECFEKSGTGQFARQARLLTDGLTPAEAEMEAACRESWHPSGQVLKAEREQLFPLGVVREFLKLSVETANASMPEDKRRILNSIAGGARGGGAGGPHRGLPFKTLTFSCFSTPVLDQTY